MDPKNRLLWSLCGKETDRRAWSPFLAYWWEAQPESFRAQGMLEFLESCGADPLLRGFGAAWSIDYREVKRSITTKGNYTTELLDTPVGTLKLGYQYSHLGNTWFLCDHPVKTVEDLKVLSWIYEHAHIYYNPDIESEYARVGNRGLLVPVIGAESKTCFQSLIEKWVGTVKLTYLLADEPQAVEDCLASMRRISIKQQNCPFFRLAKHLSSGRIVQPQTSPQPCSKSMLHLRSVLGDEHCEQLVNF
jgi:hypothetical protein